jgi:tRNA pseudouridine13 synthase
VKIKQQPEDFRVVELDRFELAASGPFALYRLVKWDIGTLEAVATLASAFQVPRAKVSFGGLKDRHARTEQVISIHGGPERSHEASSFRAEYLGRSRDPITRASFGGNRFEIVVRDLREIPDLEPVRRWGLPNYFDDQRFGSLRGTGGEFIGRALVRGEHEKALRLALASPDPADRKKHRDLEARMAAQWGDWKALKADLPSSIQKTVAAYLADHAGAFGLAFELLDQNLRVLYVSAYQSWLWNRALGALLRKLPGAFEVEYAAGRHVFYERLDPTAHDRLAELSIPLATAGRKFEGEAAAVMEAIYKEEGIEPRMLRMKKLRKTFFGKGLREALVAPAKLEARPGDDELHRGRKKLVLSFELPKGSYATILIKRLFHEALPAGADDAE